ncbi:MAG: hypothetical protein LUF30_00535 [Lachnospiraceae bacterium]|nr:hypothetical protein [Lachnospiraceae bacterium]
MATVYSETPHNFADISSFIITDREQILTRIREKKRCFFYDACSFRRHAKLEDEESAYLLEYIDVQDGVLVITRTVLMELGSHSGMLNPSYVRYFNRIKAYGIEVLVIYEEDIYSVMSSCYGTNLEINSYLVWAVRMVKDPVSTISQVLSEDRKLYTEVIEGKNLEKGDVYSRFFCAVRNSKESGDNLGEELVAICLHILSYMPGTLDGKYGMITDDKEAALNTYAMFEKTAIQYKGSRVFIFSTPKLAQVFRREGILADREHMRKILSAGTEGNLSLIPARIYDLKCKEMTMSVDELTDLIMEPTGISILF